MNEILGPIYYIMAVDGDPEWASHAEEDTFWCFMNLMSEIRDNFIKTLDKSAVGIGTLAPLGKERDGAECRFCSTCAFFFFGSDFTVRRGHDGQALVSSARGGCGAGG